MRGAPTVEENVTVTLTTTFREFRYFKHEIVFTRWLKLNETFGWPERLVFQSEE